MKINLIFHIYCIEHKMTYYAIEKLKNNIDIFTGVKIITLSAPENNFETDSYKSIIEMNDVEFITVDNNNREVNSFFDILLPSLEQKSSVDDYTFFGHNKGCTREENNLAIKIWVRTLWKYNIEKFDDLIKPELGKYKFIGCLRKIEPKLPMGNIEVVEPYHYAGAFFWFSNRIFKERWNYNNGTRWATEKWPGMLSTLDNSISVYDKENDGDFYPDNFWLMGYGTYSYLNSEKYKKFKRKYKF